MAHCLQVHVVNPEADQVGSNNGCGLVKSGMFQGKLMSSRSASAIYNVNLQLNSVLTFSTEPIRFIMLM